MPFPKAITFSDQIKWVKYLDEIFIKAEVLEKKIQVQYEDIVKSENVVLKAAFEGTL